MGNRLFAILCLSFLPSFSQAQNYVIIGGQITNSVPGERLVIVRQIYLGIIGTLTDTIRINREGYFTDTLKNVNKPFFASWSLIESDNYKNKKINLFLFPGYNFYIT